MGITLVGTSFAYLGIVASAYRDGVTVPAPLFLTLSIPLAMMIAYQMLVTAAVIRRSWSAKVIENALFAESRVRGDERDAIGTATSDRVMVPADALKSRDAWLATRIVRAWIAVGSYVIWYLVGFAVTCLNFVWGVQSLPESHGFIGYAIRWVTGAFYVTFWLAFSTVAVYYFWRRPRR